jgi:hypothetical protein
MTLNEPEVLLTREPLHGPSTSAVGSDRIWALEVGARVEVDELASQRGKTERALDDGRLEPKVGRHRTIQPHLTSARLHYARSKHQRPQLARWVCVLVRLGIGLRERISQPRPLLRVGRILVSPLRTRG